MVRGVLFDMDGVLFDTENLYQRTEPAVAKEMGFDMSPELALRCMGMNKAKVKALLVGELGEAFNYEEYDQKLRAAMDAVIEKEGLPIKPGVKALLQWLWEKNIPMAVASSSTSTTIASHLERAGFTKYFKAQVGGNMVTASKPEPDIFEEAARRIGIPPQECAAFEDSFAGVRSASSAGCYTVMVPDLLQPTKEIEALCGAVITSMEEAPALLEKYI